MPQPKRAASRKLEVVHVQTQVATVFGVVDEDGNVIAQQPITVSIQMFSGDAFRDAYDGIVEARDQAITNAQAQLAAEAKAAPRAKRSNRSDAPRRAQPKTASKRSPAKKSVAAAAR